MAGVDTRLRRFSPPASSGSTEQLEAMPTTSTRAASLPVFSSMSKSTPTRASVPPPITPTPTAIPYATALMTADASVSSFMGNPGGALGKVIRWSFEKQGLYQPSGAPTPVTSPGAPPAVDVYIDDGRHGEYPYTPDFWENTDIWNRQAADGGLAHQTPLLGVTNYVYVRLHNRGGQQANNVIVNAYHCRPSTGLLWPSDWQAMTTPQLIVPGGVPAGGSVVVGPFDWTPTVAGHECLLVYANATGDLSNADALSGLPCAAGPTPHWWLVPFDNNLGQRNVAPVAGGGGIKGLVGSLQGRHFWANNPYDHAAQVQLEVVMPEFLSERGWRLGFLNPGGAKFTLGPLASREVVLSVQPGRDFAPGDVPLDVGATMIKIRTLLDGIIVGGMSYQVDPALRRPPRERPRRARREESEELAEKLLESIGLADREVESVRLRKVTIDIEVEDEEEDEDSD